MLWYLEVAYTTYIKFIKRVNKGWEGFISKAHAKGGFV
jgi:hypothetical protein